MYPKIAGRTLGRPRFEPNPNILLRYHPSTQPQASKACHQCRHTMVEVERKQQDRKKRQHELQPNNKARDTKPIANHALHGSNH